MTINKTKSPALAFGLHGAGVRGSDFTSIKTAQFYYYYNDCGYC